MLLNQRPKPMSKVLKERRQAKERAIKLSEQMRGNYPKSSRPRHNYSRDQAENTAVKHEYDYFKEYTRFYVEYNLKYSHFCNVEEKIGKKYPYFKEEILLPIDLKLKTSKYYIPQALRLKMMFLWILILINILLIGLGIALIIIYERIYLLGIILVTPVFVNFCIYAFFKKEYEYTPYMKKRQHQLNLLLKEEFGEKLIFKSKNGADMFNIQMGALGNTIIVDVISLYNQVTLCHGGKLKIGPTDEDETRKKQLEEKMSDLEVSEGENITYEKKDQMMLNEIEEPTTQIVKTAIQFGGLPTSMIDGKL